MPTYEHLTEADIPAIYEIIDWFMDCNYEQIKRFLSEKQNIALVAKLGDKVIGLIYGYALTAFDNDKPQFFIYSVDIHPGFQNQGYGKQFVTHAVEWARNNGFCEAFVMTNKSNAPACKTYEAAGMRHSTDDDERMYEIAYSDSEIYTSQQLRL